MAITFKSVVPVLRMFDLDATLRFYRDYLGCQVDWQEGEPGGPVYLQVSRGTMVFQLSSHHGDGTPGSAVIIYTESLADLHRELHGKPYAFFNPGLEPYGSAQVMTLIDPASNLLRFFEQAGER
jgi:catechol 2,3-dioxygenase-like lactoylglutathione lyase family enzyme